MVFYVESNDAIPPCPSCRGKLVYRDRKRRIVKGEGGTRKWLMIRRFRCSKCMKLHNELPSVVLPYKHYDSEVISGVLEKVVTPDDLDSEDYPCGATMLLWIQWLQKNLKRIEGYLRAVAYELSDYDSRTLLAGTSLLASLRKSNRRWLEQVIRTIYNSGGSLVPFRH